MSTTAEPDAAPAASGVKRRDFLKILGAGSAVTASVGCSTKGVGHLIPYLVSPDQTVPGVSTYYASTCRECAASCGVLVETRDGRVIKLEGNPAHPLNRGALCARGQAAPQGLYNPDRYREPMVRKDGKLVPTTWDDALHLFAQKLGEVRSRNQAAGVAFVNLHESGTFPGFLDEWLAAYGMPAHLSYDPDLPSAVLAANRESYGVSWPGLDFSAARLIVSFGADFLDGWGASVPQQLGWADARAKIADAPRLIYIGARRSLTGLNADEWIPAKLGSGTIIANALLASLGHATGVTMAQAATASGVDVAVLQRLASALVEAKPSLVLAGGAGVAALDLAHAVNAINQAVGNVGQTIKPAEALTAFEHAATYADVRDLADRMQKGAVPLLMVRGANPAFSTPPALGFAAAMGKVPFKVSFSSYPDETAELCDLVLPDHHALESWGEAAPVMGTVSLQQPGMDPVFASRQTADVLVSVAKTDPALAAKYSWPDYRTWLISRFPGGPTGFTNALTTGVVTSGEPAPKPAAATTAAADAAPSKTAEKGQPAKGQPAKGQPAKGQLAKGQAATAAPFKSVAPVPGAALEQSHGDFYLVIYSSPALGDGRGANKPWLQELPDPVTKIVWQTVIEIHPETARKLGVAAGDHLKVETDTGSIEAPAFVYLGIRPDTVAISLGRGHTAYGRYARNQGLSPLGLIPTAEDHAGALALNCTKARVSKGGDHTLLVSTEGSARQHGRGIARAITVSELAAAPPPETNPVAGVAAPAGGGTAEGAEEEMPGDASHKFLPGLRSPVANDAQGDYGDTASKSLGMYAGDHWSGMAKRRWAMTVDLARCTGCSACVTACYAENNIPTVGAPWQGAQVLPDHTGFGANILRGREMAWIRLERYFEGANHEDGRFDPDFETRFIPMLCQQCGNAPCEPVCPVYATYHSPDGLNVQVYNRCVGTRYCSNNCPYKVRYFNWFGYGESDRIQYAFPEPLNWQLNPDVTVRGKGVMEKCTFCLQRIREAEHRARLEHRELEPDEFTVACAQACPSRAITFGDAADERWSMTKLLDDRRAYHVFEELNTFTAVVYLKRVTHPAPSAPATT